MPIAFILALERLHIALLFKIRLRSWLQMVISTLAVNTRSQAGGVTKFKMAAARMVTFPLRARRPSVQGTPE